MILEIYDADLKGVVFKLGTQSITLLKDERGYFCEFDIEEENEYFAKTSSIVLKPMNSWVESLFRAYRMIGGKEKITGFKYLGETIHLGYYELEFPIPAFEYFLTYKCGKRIYTGSADIITVCSFFRSQKYTEEILKKYAKN